MREMINKINSLMFILEQEFYNSSLNINSNKEFKNFINNSRTKELPECKKLIKNFIFRLYLNKFMPLIIFILIFIILLAFQISLLVTNANILFGMIIEIIFGVLLCFSSVFIKNVFHNDLTERKKFILNKMMKLRIELKSYVNKGGDNNV